MILIHGEDWPSNSFRVRGSGRDVQCTTLSLNETARTQVEGGRGACATYGG